MCDVASRRVADRAGAVLRILYPRNTHRVHDLLRLNRPREALPREVFKKIFFSTPLSESIDRINFFYVCEQCGPDVSESCPSVRIPRVFPRVFPRIFISFYSSHPSGCRRRRFGAILFTRRENIPTRTPRRVSFAVDSPSVTDVIDFSLWFRHTSTRRAVRKGARSVCLYAECFL